MVGSGRDRLSCLEPGTPHPRHDPLPAGGRPPDRGPGVIGRPAGEERKIGPMKVLLINPPSEHMITTNIPSVVDEERGYNPPLGLLYVAGYAKAKSPHEILVLDCQVEEVSQEEVED